MSQLVDVARQLLVGSSGLVELLAKHRVHVTQTRRALLFLLQLDERRLDVHVVISLAHAQTVLGRVDATLQFVLLRRKLQHNQAGYHLYGPNTTHLDVTVL